jgi:hypothetical protein
MSRWLVIAVLLLGSNVHADPAWKKTTVPEVGISFMMPGEPTAKVNEIDTPAGKIKARVYTLLAIKITTSPDLVDSALAFHAYVLPTAPDGDKRTPQQILDDSLAGQLQNSNSTLDRRVALTFKGNPGLEAYSHSAKDHMHTRLREFIIGRKLFMVLAVAGEGSELPASTQRFFDSVEFLK